jgi:tripartite-type tricarboxylate transporter receptor subunit TctC
MRSRFVLIATALVTAVAAGAQPAPNYPNRPVKIVVTVPAGGGVDVVTRLLADRLNRRLGQPFVVENRGGGGGNIATEAVFNAPPDGYTLLATSPSSITTNAVLTRLNHDVAALEPVVVMSKAPNVLLVRQNFPARTAQEFMIHVRANPGKLNYASQSVGSTSHLTTELFMTLTGTKFVHVPYKGTAPALNDIVAGHVDFIFMELAAAYRLHEGGKARILAVATDRRIAALPDVPTMSEAGVADFVSDTWNAIAAPPRTPAPVVERLNGAVNEIVGAPDTRKQFGDLNLVPGGGSPAEAKAFVAAERKRWTEVIERAGIKGE